MAPEDERAPQASPSPPPEPGGLSGARGDLGGGPEEGFGSGVSGELYHERQRLELCALHALNNLLQRPWLSKAAADGICRRLAPNSRPNPHRSPLGTGNYDINVVMAALATLGLAAVWWDKRRVAFAMLGLAAVWWDKRRPLERLSVSPILGFLLNVPSRPRLGALQLPLARPHWLSVRRLGRTFYNLDSKLATPIAIGNETQLREFLQRVLDEGSSELFLVVPREVEEEGTWLSPE